MDSIKVSVVAFLIIVSGIYAYQVNSQIEMAREKQAYDISVKNKAIEEEKNAADMEKEEKKRLLDSCMQYAEDFYGNKYTGDVTFDAKIDAAINSRYDECIKIYS